MSQFPIFKVNRLSNKNKTDTIYVFCGSTFSDENLNDLFVENPNNKIFATLLFDKGQEGQFRRAAINFPKLFSRNAIVGGKIKPTSGRVQ